MIIRSFKSVHRINDNSFDLKYIVKILWEAAFGINENSGAQHISKVSVCGAFGEKVLNVSSGIGH